jgi:broad specificity phosphatase PhoE
MVLVLATVVRGRVHAVAVVRYITHPDVVVDPATPVSEWRLSDRGRDRLTTMLMRPWVDGICRVVSSEERKALETVVMLADHLGVTAEVRPSTGEVDRSSTGFVPADEHERLADECFAHPELSAAGWERALDAQLRIVAALDDLVASMASMVTSRSSAMAVSARCGGATSPANRSTVGGISPAKVTTSPSNAQRTDRCISGRPSTSEPQSTPMIDGTLVTPATTVRPPRSSAVTPRLECARDPAVPETPGPRTQRRRLHGGDRHRSAPDRRDAHRPGTRLGTAGGTRGRARAVRLGRPWPASARSPQPGGLGRARTGHPAGVIGVGCCAATEGQALAGVVPSAGG